MRFGEKARALWKTKNIGQRPLAASAAEGLPPCWRRTTANVASTLLKSEPTIQRQQYSLKAIDLA